MKPISISTPANAPNWHRDANDKIGAALAGKVGQHVQSKAGKKWRMVGHDDPSGGNWFLFQIEANGGWKTVAAFDPGGNFVTRGASRAGSSLAGWTKTTAYALNATIGPALPNGHVYTATTGGTSGATEPRWPTSAGATVADGTAVWTESGASTSFDFGGKGLDVQL